jgi:membrane associated rhomboid family serine protease
MKTTPFSIIHFHYPVTIILMAVLCLLSLLTYRFKSMRLKLILHPVSVLKDKEYYRLFSSDLIHHDLVHLLLNEFLLFIYGATLEDYLNQRGRYGSLEFLLIYLMSCFFGAAGTTIVNRKDFGFTSAGASGSIIGCVFSYVILKPGRVAFFLPVIGAVTNIYLGLVVIVLIFAYQWRSNNELINQEQHFFGALGGMLVTFMIFPGIIK